jgi:hypothetical protein
MSKVRAPSRSRATSMRCVLSPSPATCQDHRRAVPAKIPVIGRSQPKQTLTARFTSGCQRDGDSAPVVDGGSGRRFSERRIGTIGGTSTGRRHPVKVDYSRPDDMLQAVQIKALGT